MKTSFAPGSHSVDRYLKDCGVLTDLETLGFHIVGYGCTTCNGNSGASPESGGGDRCQSTGRDRGAQRQSQFRRAGSSTGSHSFLASPPLVVAYALTGRIDVDLTRESLGNDSAGSPVFLKDLWPTAEQLRDAMARFVKPGVFQEDGNPGNSEWEHVSKNNPPCSPGTTVRFLSGGRRSSKRSRRSCPSILIWQARLLAVLGDDLSTDHSRPTDRSTRKVRRVNISCSMESRRRISIPAALPRES